MRPVLLLYLALLFTSALSSAVTVGAPVIVRRSQNAASFEPTALYSVTASTASRPQPAAGIIPLRKRTVTSKTGKKCGGKGCRLYDGVFYDELTPAQRKVVDKKLRKENAIIGGSVGGAMVLLFGGIILWVVCSKTPPKTESAEDEEHEKGSVRSGSVGDEVVMEYRSPAMLAAVALPLMAGSAGYADGAPLSPTMSEAVRRNQEKDDDYDDNSTGYYNCSCGGSGVPGSWWTIDWDSCFQLCCCCCLCCD